ncbi:MAG: hypothetical protein ILO68_02285 [Clostridia bacterium]|nr:hypothetical protein [Clostridia bacterium]
METCNGSKWFLRISDIAILLLCVLSILGYFILPFWKVTVSVHPNAEATEAVLRTAEDAGMDEEGLTMFRSVLSDLEKQPDLLEVSVRVRTADILASLFTDDLNYVSRHWKDVIMDALSGSSDSLKNLINVLENLYLKMNFRDMVADAIRASGGSLSELDAILRKTGIGDDWVASMLEKIRKAAEAENATTDSVTAAIMDVMDEASEKMRGVPEYTAMAMQFDAQKDVARQEIRKTLKGAEDENGRIQYDRLVSQILAPYLELAMNAFGSGSVSTNPDASPSGATEPDSEEGGLSAALKSTVLKIADDFLSRIPEKGLDYALAGMRIVAIAILVVFAVWMLLFVFAAVKAFSKINPGVPVIWVPVVFGWPHFPALVLFPSLLLANEGALARSLLDLTGAGTSILPSGNPDLLPVFFRTVRISFSSGSVFAMVSALILFVLLFFCAHHSKKIRRLQPST